MNVADLSASVSAALAQVDWFGLVVVPLLIFSARVVDVSIGTLRIVFIGRGMALPSAVAGFVESLIWLLAVTQIIQNLTMPLYYVAYAAGFGAGNYVGLAIERRLALGLVIVQLMLTEPAEELLIRLRKAGVGATTIEAQGMMGPVSIVYTVVPRRDLRDVLTIMRSLHPEAFYTVEGVTQVDRGVFRHSRMRGARWTGRQRK
jgi:uncharacterized protein YebE (UPF0316 family)